MNVRFTDYDVMMALLRIYARARSLNIANVVGSVFGKSELEGELGGIQMTREERTQAMRCARELNDLGLVVSTFTDSADREGWRAITQSGRNALQRGALDELDHALLALSSEFVVMRRGAWRAANSSDPETARHAAHSGRELVDQVLHLLSPNEEVISRPWYNSPDPNKQIVTRNARYRNAIERRGRGRSDNELAVAKKGGELLDALHKQLSANAHAHGPADRQAVVDALRTAEMVLRKLLI